jgi:hypothetical protein
MIPRLIQESGWLRAHYPGELKGGEGDKDKTKGLFHRDEPSAAQRAFLGGTAHVSVLARDWREAYSITDGQPLLFDRVRLIRSSRMAVTRFALAGGRFMPYAEVSFGQWRADPDLMPYLHSSYVLAAQAAVGFEMHVAPRCAVAWNVEQTKMNRDSRDPQNLPLTSLFASFAAVRAEF